LFFGDFFLSARFGPLSAWGQRRFSAGVSALETYSRSQFADRTPDRRVNGAPAVAQTDLSKLADDPPNVSGTASKQLSGRPREPADRGADLFRRHEGLSVFLIKSTEGLIVLNTGMRARDR